MPRETITVNEDLDVVIHIHGGAFTVGDPASNAGPDYVMDRDLIFVTMNFRMGILGNFEFLLLMRKLYRETNRIIQVNKNC